MALLEVSSLTKRWPRGEKLALDNVGFGVDRGEIVGLLGHNGAGKSTIMGITLGMVRPDAGEVRIGGRSVQRERAAALGQIGAIYEAASFYDYLTGWQNLKVLCSLSGWWDADEARRVLKLVQLHERADSLAGTYSHGMRQRLALAQSLLPEPEVLLLDEPTDGLDPEGIKWFRDFILQLRDDRGMTVLFNSHLLAEVELMCDRVAILRAGKRVFEGTVGGLHDDDQFFDVELEPWGTACGLVHAMGGDVPSNGRIRLPQGADPSALVETFVRAGVRVRAFAPVRRSLEDLYMEILNGAGSPN